MRMNSDSNVAGWNFFLHEALLIPLEIPALNLVLSSWRDDIPVEAVVAGCIVFYLQVHATFDSQA